jgi:hypothetical protein
MYSTYIIMLHTKHDVPVPSAACQCRERASMVSMLTSHLTNRNNAGHAAIACKPNYASECFLPYGMHAVPGASLTQQTSCKQGTNAGLAWHAASQTMLLKFKIASGAIALHCMASTHQARHAVPSAACRRACMQRSCSHAVTADQPSRKQEIGLPANLNANNAHYC